MIRLLAGFAIAIAAAEAAALDFESCRLAAAGGRIEAAARCARLALPLNPADAASGEIDLHVAVVDALAEDAREDPLVVIAGGPGQAASAFYAGLQGAFEPIRRQRDIVLIDQRGTGRSTPLDCAAGEGLEALDVAGTLAAIRACLDGLGVDPRWFTTSLAVADLERVRAALGYQRWNLYGVSYGTRVALHYLRRYREATRRVILDGVLPPDVPLGPEIPIHAQSALDQLLQRCARVPACARAWPRLGERFRTVLGALETAPAPVEVPDPRSGELRSFDLQRDQLAGAIRLALYAPENAAILPPLIDAAARGDYRPIAASVLLIGAQFEEEVAQALNFSIVCAEDVPAWPKIDRSMLTRTFFGARQIDTLLAACAFWPRGPVDADFHDPVVSDAPVMLLSGGADPITPPGYAKRAAAHLANALEVVLPELGHGMARVGCVPRSMEAFLSADDPMSIDTGCVEAVAPFPIFTSPLGPSP